MTRLIGLRDHCAQHTCIAPPSGVGLMAALFWKGYRVKKYLKNITGTDIKNFMETRES